MTTEAIVGMCIILSVTVGGFIYFLGLALKDKD